MSTAIAPGGAYFLNLTDRDFACLLPFDGLKAIFSFVESLPGFFWVSLNVSVSRPLADFELLDKPLPEAVRMPAAGTDTETVSVRPLILWKTIEMPVEQPVTLIGVDSWISALSREAPRALDVLPEVVTTNLGWKFETRTVGGRNS